MPPVTAPTLVDGPVTLRHPQESDVQGSWEQCQDPLSIEWTTVPVPYSHDDARSFVLGFVPGAWDTDKEWGFVVEAEGRYAGHVALRNEGSGRAELAYGSHPWVRGQGHPMGHMERAIRLLLEWGFREKDLATVIWMANVGNWASRRLAWKLGFSFEGTLRQWLPHRGELRDAWVGTLLADDPREPRRRWLDDVVLEGPADGPAGGLGIRLRPFREEDAARVVEACRDDRTHQWLSRMPSPYELEDALDYIRGRTTVRATGDGLDWAVVDPATDEVIGSIGIFDLSDDLAVGEVGYWTHPDARGRGVMTAAVGVVLRYAFEGLGLQRVKAHAAVDNSASRRVLEANGLTAQGVERLGTFVRGARADAVVYDVLRGEWARRAASAH